jgi:hypothetical protein
VLSGFSQIQIGFENLLKNGFEKLEKEKENGKSAHLGFGPTQPQPAASACPACGPPLSSAPRSRSGRAQVAAAGPSSRARSLPPHPSR